MIWIWEPKYKLTSKNCHNWSLELTPAKFLIAFALLFSPVLVFGGEYLPPESDSIVLTSNPKEIHQKMWENLKPSMARWQAMEMGNEAKMATNWAEYDARYYGIDLQIDDDNEVIYGIVHIQGIIKSSFLDSIMVNLSGNLTVDSVFVSNRSLEFLHEYDHLTVYLSHTHAWGKPFNFSVAYHGTPAGSFGFIGFSFSERMGMPLIATLSQPMGARSWWPCNDIPQDKADSVDIIVTVDNGLIVSSNGLMQSDMDNGDGTHTVHWKESYPIAPYLVSLGIHPYSVWYDWYHYSPTDSMPLQYYVFPDHDGYSRPRFGVIPYMLEILTGYFGEYPFIEEKYGCTHFDWGGAMEHQTNSSTTANDLGYSELVIVHELGHQWWGDLVTCANWRHIWINEGFAVYSEALYFEADSGIDYYHTFMNSFDYYGDGSVYIDDTTSIWEIFGPIVFDKGGWVLHMLRHVVGDSLFFESLADYREQFGGKSATTEDFRDVVETTCGMELDWFFQQWIYGTYRPFYHYSFLTEEDPAGGWNTHLHIRQVQTTNPLVFTMPIDLRIITPSKEDAAVVFNDKRSQNFVLHTETQPTNMFLDQKRWISRIVNRVLYTIHITHDSLPDGIQGDPYEDSLMVRCESGDYYCEVISGQVPDGWNLDPTTGVISGISYDFGSISFTVEASDMVNPDYKDSVEFTIFLYPIYPIPGDANVDGDVNVGDIVYIINFIFKEGAEPPVPNWADVNYDCLINVGDAVFLINYVFRDGAEPTLGCVE
jgi:hypothetical protein